MSSPGAESRGTAGPPRASGRNKGQEAGAGRREQVRDLVPILGQVRTLLIVGRKGAAKGVPAHRLLNFTHISNNLKNRRVLIGSQSLFCHKLPPPQKQTKKPSTILTLKKKKKGKKDELSVKDTLRDHDPRVLTHFLFTVDQQELPR